MRQFSAENVKGHGHRTLKTRENDAYLA